MRDINRIDGFCQVIAEKWKTKCPDWRFGQLMINFLSWLGYDPFYMEEDKFLAKFEEFMNTI